MFSRSLLIIAACSGALACSGGAQPSGTTVTHPPKDDGTTTQSGALTVFPTQVFVGFDEKGPLAQAPVALTGASGSVAWTSADDSVAAVSGSAVSAKISAVKAGSSAITVKAGSASAEVKVTVLSYTAAAVASGEQEYKTAGCAGCHEAADGPDITPSGVGKHTDDQILGAAHDAKNPEGGDIASPNHKFAVTNAVVAYLRSLPAKTDSPKADE
jgi:hypothetical protein